MNVKTNEVCKTTENMYSELECTFPCLFCMTTQRTFSKEVGVVPLI